MPRKPGKPVKRIEAKRREYTNGQSTVGGGGDARESTSASPLKSPVTARELSRLIHECALLQQPVAKVRPSSSPAAGSANARVHSDGRCLVSRAGSAHAEGRRSIDAMTDWFARPVLHVSNVEASLRFYVDRLAFTVAWRYEENGRARVAQVDRGSCALIFAEQWPEKVGKGLMFISLNAEPETHDAGVAALDALRAELEARGVPVKDGHWGYRLLVVEDLAGNQLFFNYPNEP